MKIAHLATSPRIWLALAGGMMGYNLLVRYRLKLTPNQLSDFQFILIGLQGANTILLQTTVNAANLLLSPINRRLSA